MSPKLSKAKLPKEVDLFVKQVTNFLAQMDVVMSGPSSVERGQKVAKLCGELELAKDMLSHFGIKGWPTKKPKSALAGSK